MWGLSDVPVHHERVVYLDRTLRIGERHRQDHARTVHKTCTSGVALEIFPQVDDLRSSCDQLGERISTKLYSL